MNERSQGLARLIPLYIACYVGWLAFAALTFWTVLEFRNVVLGLITVVGPWVIGALDKFGLILFMLIGMAWIIYLETYLREGIGKGVFWRRMARVTMIQAIVLGIAYGLQLLQIFL